MKKILQLLIVLSVTGCAYVENIETPYANPELTENYSTLRVHEPNKPFVSLSKLDGVYGSKSPIDGVRDVYLMRIMPGLHSITAYCSVVSTLSYTKGIGVEFEYAFEPNTEYELSCKTDSQESKGFFVLTESGREVEMKVLRLFKPGGGSY